MTKTSKEADQILTALVSVCEDEHYQIRSALRVADNHTFAETGYSGIEYRNIAQQFENQLADFEEWFATHQGK